MGEICSLHVDPIPCTISISDSKCDILTLKFDFQSYLRAGKPERLIRLFRKGCWSRSAWTVFLPRSRKLDLLLLFRANNYHLSLRYVTFDSFECIPTKRHTCSLTFSLRLMKIGLYASATYTKSSIAFTVRIYHRLNHRVAVFQPSPFSMEATVSQNTENQP